MSRHFGIDYEESVTLKDGRILMLRPVRPEDKPLFVHGVEHYGREALYLRFMTSKASLSDAELAYLTEVDGWDHFALIALDREVGAGVGRVIRYRHVPDSADCGIFIGDPYQSQGLGRILFQRMIEAAQERGIGLLCGEMFSTNTAMFTLVDTCGYPAEWLLDGAVASFRIEIGA